ncbi:MAG: hypothetical protein K2I10_04395 [Lachnospiraceae bacterium]|nr:hypothetical protein [Lachnospiraceae bacterium]
MCCYCRNRGFYRFIICTGETGTQFCWTVRWKRKWYDDFELTDEEMEKINALDREEKHDWY